MRGHGQRAREYKIQDTDSLKYPQKKIQQYIWYIKRGPNLIGILRFDLASYFFNRGEVEWTISSNTS